MYKRQANNGAKVKAELTNKGGSVSTAEATLTTVIDQDAPEVTSITAYAGTLNQIIITFNEPLNATTAANTANYKIDGLEISSAEVSEDGQTVTLATSQQNAGDYSVAISGVKDTSSRGNAVEDSVSFKSAIDYAMEIVSDGPVIYWKLAETGGNVAKDHMGIRNGTYVSANQSGLPTLNLSLIHI